MTSVRTASDGGQLGACVQRVNTRDHDGDKALFGFLNDPVSRLHAAVWK